MKNWKFLFIPLALLMVIFVGQKNWLRKPASGSDFVASCTRQAKEKKAEPTICVPISEMFFHSEEIVSMLEPGDIGAPILPVDKKAKIIAIAKPTYVARLAYCYFQFRKWFDPKTLSPEQLALSASGFAILSDEIAGYREWLQSQSGQECIARVKSYSGEGIVDIDMELKGYVSLIAINPIASIQENGGKEAVKQDALQTINHERIHVLQATCSDLNIVATNLWNQLPAFAKDEMKNKYPAYDWNNSVVAIRENLALKYEMKPLEVLALAKNCTY